MSDEKPILIKKEGRSWLIYDKGVPLTTGSNKKPALPDFPNYDLTGKPWKFKSYDDAKGAAHALGKFVRKYANSDFIGVFARVDRGDGKGPVTP